MEDYRESCLKFINDPTIDPDTNKPINDRKFDFYRGLCYSYYEYNIPLPIHKKILYTNQSYGKRICQSFLKFPEINPLNGVDLYEGTKDYQEFIDLCNHYKFNTRNIEGKKMVRSVEKSDLRPRVINNSEAIRLEEEKYKTNKSSNEPDNYYRRTGLLPVPKEFERSNIDRLIPKGNSQRFNLLPVPNRIGRKTNEINSSNLLNVDLRKLANEVHKDNRVKKLVLDNLDSILEKHGNYDKKYNRYVLSSNNKKYGVEQFIFDLMIENETELIKKIFNFYNLEYIDISQILFDYPEYATNESLLFNYFMNSPLDVDWSELEQILEDVYGNWIIEDKLNLLILLISSAISVGNDFIINTLNKVYENWQEGIQDEFLDMEDQDERDKIFDLIGTLDVLTTMD